MIDETDRAILDLLLRDGRMSNREIGRELGIAEGTVRQRLKKLETAKAARLRLLTDPFKLGLTANAYVRIKTAPMQARRVATELAAYPEVPFVGLTLGRFDLVAFVSTETREQLADLIDRRIAALPGVRETDVREVVGYSKHRYELARIF